MTLKFYCSLHVRITTYISLNDPIIFFDQCKIHVDLRYVCTTGIHIKFGKYPQSNLLKYDLSLFQVNCYSNKIERFILL